MAFLDSFVLASLFAFSSKKQIIQFIGYRSIIDSLKKFLISNRLCVIINSPINKNLTRSALAVVSIKLFEKEDIPKVIEFEYELRKQEPNTYYWEPDQDYVMQLEKSFADERFNTAISLIAHRNGQVIGRIDASIISSRSDASCFSAYLDWICVLKSERHNKVAQTLLEELKKELKERGVGLLIALMANNNEAQRFYNSVKDASIHDTGIWIDIK